MKNESPEVQQSEKLKAAVRRLADSAPVIIWMTDDRGAFIYLNQGVADSIHDAGGIALQNWLDFIHPEDMDRMRLLYQNVKKTRREYQVEYRILKSDGTVRWMLGCGAPRTSREGVFQGFCGASIDVTTRHNAVMALEKSEMAYRKLAESTSDLISHHAMESGNFLFASPSCQSILGYEADELMGTSVYGMVHPDDITTVRDEVARQSQTAGRSILIEFRIRRSDGQYIWLGTTAQLVFDASGKPIGNVAVSREITAERLARQELREREEQFRSLTALSSDWYWETDVDGCFTFISDGIERLFGIKASAVIGITRSERTSAPDQEALVEYRAKCAARESFRNIVYTANGWPPGTIRHAAISGEPKFDGGVFAGYRGVGRDITEEIEVSRMMTRLAAENNALIENSLDIMAMLDEHGRILRVNAAIHDLLGYEPDELLGRSYTRLLVSEAGERNQTPDLFQHRVGNIINDFESRCMRRDGSIVTLSFSARWSEEQKTMYVSGRDVTERNRIQERLEQMATHDSLTGLPNRTLINRRLQHMLDFVADDASVAVMFIDLDRFKEVNDSMGHTLGDVLLQGVAARLSATMRPGDVIARLGGDEFIAAAHCAGGTESAARIAARILDTFTEPFDIEGKEVFVSASIGISIYPQDAEKKELLFQNADTAMYQAKSEGRNRYRFFEEKMSHAAKTRLTLEQALRRALERNEFELHYQPRVELKTMSVIGMEALLRWNHPELGMIPPLQFISIAEECGFIESIGQWVLQQACCDTARLVRELGIALTVSVNLSARQLQCADLVEQVAGALHAAKLPPHMLELELTESALIDDMDASVRTLTELKSRGLLLSVDDFGTGYCGLSYLQRFPFDVLKLDRSFITAQIDDARKSTFIKAVIDLAHALDLTVVAEGIETGDMQRRLRELGCDQGQGYLFSKPLPIAAFERFLATEVRASPTEQEG